MKKFTLRDLFWLLLVVAILCAWWIDHHQQATQVKDYEAKYKTEARKRWALEMERDAPTQP